MTRALVTIALACCLSPAMAVAEELTWDDPTLAQAVADADVIVLAVAEAVASNGVAYRVEASFKGPKTKGQRIAVTGLHHPELRDRPPIEKGARAYLLLRGDVSGEGFRLPTPTFGRFTRSVGDAGELAVISLGGHDTFARIAVPVARVEALLEGLVSGSAPELLTECRRVVAAPETDDPEALYLATAVVGLFGTRADAVQLLALLREPSLRNDDSLRIRLHAAHGLGRIGGARGARELLKIAADDPAASLRSVAFSAVGSALSGKKDPRVVRIACKALADLVSDQPTEAIRFGNARDPRKNAIDSPYDACLRSLARLGSRLGIKPALRGLESEDLQAITAGLAYFSALGDLDQAGEIIARMRPKDSVDAFVNRLFARTLSQLSGEDLGPDRSEWRSWWKAREKGLEPAGPSPGGPK